MSQSPQESKEKASAATVQNYRDAWSALSHLIGQGKSFSGNERNCFFLNTQDGKFSEAAGAFGVDLNDDSRAVALTDWNFDGALDVWLSNRTAPRVRLLLNQPSKSRRWLRIRLQGTESNRDAIGARVTLVAADSDRQLMRTVRAGDGFLAQSSKWLHFGLGDSVIDHLQISWPSGKKETIRGVRENTHVKIVEGQGRAERWTPPIFSTSAPTGQRELAAAPSGTSTRTWIMGRVPLIAHQYDKQGVATSTDDLLGRPLLINLWSKDCQPCWRELREWANAADEFTSVGCNILALSVDSLTHGRSSESLHQIRWPFEEGRATAEFVSGLEIVQRAFIEWQQPLPVPSSFLVDKAGFVAAVYRGAVSVETILQDVRLLGAPPEEQRDAAVPFQGKWASDVFPSDPAPLIKMLDVTGESDKAIAYLQRYIQLGEPRRVGLASAYSALASRLVEMDRFAELTPMLPRLRELAPQSHRLHRQLGYHLLRHGQMADALAHLELATKVHPNDAVLLFNAGLAAVGARNVDRAVTLFRRSVSIDPNDATAHFHLANAHLFRGEADAAIGHYEAAHRIKPGWSLPANNLAWLLCTSRDDSLRDGVKALRLIEPFCRDWEAAGSSVDPSLLSTYAAALAEVGRFKQAEQVNRRAATSLRNRGRTQEANQLRTRGEQYRLGNPVRE